MFVIAVQAEKGGVGKTTTAVSLAYILAEEHKARVLLIDADQQGNASQLVQRYDPEHSGTVDVLEGNREITAAALPVTLERFRKDYYFDILTANGYLMNTNADILQDTVQDQVHRLRKALHAARGWYDYVLIDCGLLMDMAVLNAMVAADMWIVPMRPGGLEADAVANAEERLEELRQLNPDLFAIGLLVAAGANKKHAEVYEWLARETRLGAIPVVIPRGIIGETYTAARMPLPAYRPRCKISDAYRQVARYVAEVACVVAKKRKTGEGE